MALGKKDKMEKKNIPLFKVFMAPSAKKEVGKVLDSGYIGQGAKVEEFEEKLEDWFRGSEDPFLKKRNTLVTTNSGTSALHLALHMLKKPFDYGFYRHDYMFPGIQEGDEILATPLTCTASNWPILANGFKIKWVDIDPTTLNMDLDDLARKITPKTKAIMLVHWGGYPNDLNKIDEILRKASNIIGFKPMVIEDGAHSFGSKYKGEYLGYAGNENNLFMYSFQAIKHLTSVDGGALICRRPHKYQNAKLLRWYGIDRECNSKDFRCEANIQEWGFKFHMNDINATVGIENLKHAFWITHQHKSNADYYDKNLKDTPKVTLLKREKGFDSSFWIYSMLVEDRDKFYTHMKNCGITVSQVHERNDKHTTVQEFKTILPNLDKTIDKIVSIPVGWWVTEEDRKYIVECIKKGW